MDLDDNAPSLRNLVIGSVDTLTEKELPTRIPPTWNDRPPLLRGPRGTPETTLLLKGVIRQGIPPALRCAVWLSNVFQAVHPRETAEYWHEYRTLQKAEALGQAYDRILDQILYVEKVNDETRREREERVQQLWLDISFQPLKTMTYPEGTTIYGKLAHKRVCMSLQRLLGLIDLVPSVPFLVIVLLTAQSESYAFCTLREMAHAPNAYFPVSKIEEIAWGKAFGDVMEKLHPQTAEYLDDRGVFDDLSPMFRHFFTTILPLQFCCRIMDVYTLEGSKVLFRFGVALLVLFKKDAAEQLMTISNAEEWWRFMRQWAQSPRFNFDMIVRKAYGIHGRAGLRRPMRFPRRHILRRIIRMEEERALQSTFIGEEEDEVAASLFDSPSEPLGLQIPPLLLDPDETVPEPVLAVPRAVRLSLAAWMPLTLRMVNLNLLFSTNCHGRTLEMFYNRVQRAKHTILLCEVLSSAMAETTIVGFYASQPWRPSPKVYGDGSCFLFRVQPDPRCWKWSPRVSSDMDASKLLDLDHSDDTDYSRNNATALLEQFMVSTQSYISMGGNSDGSAGLRFNEDFTVAESSTAEGFGNEPLHGESESVFQVGLVEVYGVVQSLDGKSVI
ncbi:hypothetical protein FisN_22Hh230 [Fistulifera solaris]|uniref:Oxidation resistance protein 1 n=1 Tax=Fistulifera solaris TaxID=1519565 RepID=A0A1Z5KPF8_FISSO|nr:hypothetical protein FisN_22Hh230 [Fistulifera solaris]|eukprot:GAX28204.1 hypothetical protein FisN_22Hh230 [Fistulifera solaris]